MKKSIRLLSLVLSLGMLIGCSANPSGDSEKSNSNPDDSQQTSEQSSSQAGNSKSSSQAGKSSSYAGTSIPETAGEFTFDETALSIPQEIHTADQKKYLNLNKQYYHITADDLTSCYAMGNSNKSAPNKVTVSWNFGAPTGKTVSKFQLVYGQNQTYLMALQLKAQPLNQ